MLEDQNNYQDCTPFIVIQACWHAPRALEPGVTVSPTLPIPYLPHPHPGLTNGFAGGRWMSPLPFRSPSYPAPLRADKQVLRRRLDVSPTYPALTRGGQTGLQEEGGCLPYPPVPLPTPPLPGTDKPVCSGWVAVSCLPYCHPGEDKQDPVGCYYYRQIRRPWKKLFFS